MKKYLTILFSVVTLVALLCFSMNSMAAGGFKKYEDFENYPLGAFDSNEKFLKGGSCDGTVADVAIEDYNGSRQAKFTYSMTTPDSSCWLNFRDCPERILGIKADVTIASCADDQDCRARIRLRGKERLPSKVKRN